MIFFPAIDIYDGSCVRLEKGDFKKEKYTSTAGRFLLANLLPISGKDLVVIFFAKYIAICLGLAKGLERL